MGPEDEDDDDARFDASSADAAMEAGLDAASTDAGSNATSDGGEAGSVDDCHAHTQKVAQFVASHRACANDDDCVLVGDCSHSDFQVVARGAEAEAKTLLFDGDCNSADGPGYFARCRDAQCVGIKSRVQCGRAEQTECPPGMVMHKTACAGVNPTGMRAGCYTPCKAQGDDGPCTSGYTCQKGLVDPCPATSGAGEGWLCMPVSACQVELSVAFDGESVARIVNDEASELTLWLVNRTDQPLTFSYELPCNGPAVVGLADYDLWRACLAGVCPTPRERVQVTLAAHERQLYRRALVEMKPTTCNMHGLAPGKYTPTFALPYVQGANVCGPTGTLLVAGSATP